MLKTQINATLYPLWKMWDSAKDLYCFEECNLKSCIHSLWSINKMISAVISLHNTWIAHAWGEWGWGNSVWDWNLMNTDDDVRKIYQSFYAYVDAYQKLEHQKLSWSFFSSFYWEGGGDEGWWYGEGFTETYMINWNELCYSKMSRTCGL